MKCTGDVAHAAEHLISLGFVVLDGLTSEVVEDARRCIMSNIGLLKNTRPNQSSGHIAGFHRYPQFERLHSLVSSDPVVLDVLKCATDCSLIRSIGLSDITMNRSQQWHVDLLRGRYQHHLTPDICWGSDGGGVYKVLLYLQAGTALRVVPGAHTCPVALDDDRKSEPPSSRDIQAVKVEAGGIVVMDVRLPHRGSTDDEMSDSRFAHDPKILVSTVLAGDGKPLAEAMERGNSERLCDWDSAHRGCSAPQLSSRQMPILAVRA